MKHNTPYSRQRAEAKRNNELHPLDELARDALDPAKRQEDLKFKRLMRQERRRAKYLREIRREEDAAPSEES